MLARLSKNPIFLSKIPSFLSKIPALANQPFSSSQSVRHSLHLQPLATNPWSLLNQHKSFSSNQGASGGNNGEHTWKFTAESDEKDSIFESEEGKISGSSQVESISPWDEGSSVDVERDIFEGMDGEIAPKEGGGDVVWETSEGYKPWSMGEDDEKSDVFGVGEVVGMEGFEGEVVDEFEKGRNEEEEKLKQREQELMATINGS